MKKILLLLSFIHFAFPQSFFDKLEEKPSSEMFITSIIGNNSYKELKNSEMFFYTNILLIPDAIYRIPFPSDKYSYMTLNPKKVFITLLGRAIQTERVGDKEMAAEAYALLLVSLKYGTLFQKSYCEGDLNVNITDLKPHALEGWLDNKVKSLNGERFYRRFLLVAFSRFSYYWMVNHKTLGSEKRVTCGMRLQDLIKEANLIKD